MKIFNWFKKTNYQTIATMSITVPGTYHDNYKDSFVIVHYMQSVEGNKRNIEYIGKPDVLRRIKNGGLTFNAKFLSEKKLWLENGILPEKADHILIQQLKK